MKLVAPTAAHRASYDWQYSTDGATWLDLPSTLRAATTMTDPSPGTPLHFRYRALTKAGQTAWSAPIRYRPVLKAGAGDWSAPVTFTVK